MFNSVLEDIKDFSGEKPRNWGLQWRKYFKLLRNIIMKQLNIRMEDKRKWRSG